MPDDSSVGTGIPVAVIEMESTSVLESSEQGNSSESTEGQQQSGWGVRTVSTDGSSPMERVQKLHKLLSRPTLLNGTQCQQLFEFLGEHHLAFCLDEYERGETDLLEMEIDTGTAHPKKLPARRMPFAIRKEVALQLKKMQEAGVVQPSSSPWSSPVVMVQKRDGTHRFCIDYRELNKVTKADTYPLPRIDDILDQLGRSHYFSTLDLAAGYWQIRVHASSQEKTAFSTPQGLYEFRVMPFGLTNAPAVFQRLMERTLRGLNPDEGPDFVVVYIDDVLVFSRTLEEHLKHLRAVIERLQSVGLKLKPTKCHFVREQVEYLGHLITPNGLRPNPKLVEAVEQFPVPCNLKSLRRFVGLCSYYRRFVPHFAKLAAPLHQLTRKDQPFHWSLECQHAFEELKHKLTSASVLAYPSFDKNFVLETDASNLGLGAVLSQLQDDGHVHPVAYASRGLSRAETNYSVTDLETLAVVWAITYFHSFLYGHDVTVLTDHTAVKAVLETPNPSGKYARWWTRVYGRGVRNVKIIHRSGKTNLSADALSRCPHSPANREDRQVSMVSSSQMDVSDLLTATTAADILSNQDSLSQEQHKDADLHAMAEYLQKKQLPGDQEEARRIILQSTLFVIKDDVLFFHDPKKDICRVAVPKHLRTEILEENHRNLMGAHFSADKLYHTLARHW